MKLCKGYKSTEGLGAALCVKCGRLDVLRAENSIDSLYSWELDTCPMWVDKRNSQKNNKKSVKSTFFR